VTLLAALFGALMISFSAIFFALSEVDPLTGTFFRGFYAIPILALLWWLRRHDDQRGPRRHWLALAAGLALGLDVIAWHTAIGHIGAGLATLIANSQVIFVSLVAWIFLGERPSNKVLGAIPVILFGVALVSGLGQEDAFGSNPVLGAGLALLAAVFYAAFILGFRHANEAQAPPAGPLLEATIGLVLVTPVVGLFGSGVDFTISFPSHGWLVALALAAQVAGWLLIGYALPRLPAAETATIILLQPALTLIWGAMILSERPSSLQLVGVGIVLAGVGYVALARSRKPEMSTAGAT
jgi:drug/metabolite transporter (DMT)-like permease